MNYNNKDSENNIPDIELLKDREKRVKRNEKIALIMLIIGAIGAFAGLKISDTLYKTYQLMTSSVSYTALMARDKENDNLDDVKKIMDEIENIYNTSYVKDIEREDIDERVCNALIQAYGDKYGLYRDNKESDFNVNSIHSEIKGIGILSKVDYDDTNSDEFKEYIMDVYDNGPADKAGVKKGWYITKVNGKQLSLSKYDFSKSTEDIRGEEGTTVDITFIDSEGKEVTKTITRSTTKTYTVRYQKATDDIGYIIIRNFEEDTPKEFNDAMKYFKEQNINKFIFDVRNNSGGLKDSVVKIIDTLLPEGIILTEYNSAGDEVAVDMSDKNCIDFKSVTLIKNNTASAAELFTQSLIDYNKTITIGETTLGKGTICTTLPLSNGGSLTLSTGKYLTKSKKEIEEKGITPDIKMKLPKDKINIYYKLTLEEDDLVQRAIEELHKEE